MHRGGAVGGLAVAGDQAEAVALQHLAAGAGNRRVEEGEPRAAARAASASMRPGSQVEVHSAMRLRPGGGGFDQPALAFDHLLDLGDGHHRDERERGAAGNLGDAVDRLAAHAGELLAPRRVDVEADHAIAGIEQAPRQRSAHQADADQADSA